MEKTKAFNGRRFLYNVGKLILDLTKLCFGSLVLGSVIRGEIPTYILLTGGVIATTAGVVSGIILVSLFEE